MNTEYIREECEKIVLIDDIDYVSWAVDGLSYSADLPADADSFNAIMDEYGLPNVEVYI